MLEDRLTRLQQRSPIDRFLVALTRWAAKRPLVVLVLAAIAVTATWGYASGLHIKGSFVELLPTEDETAKRFRGTVARKGGTGSTLIVIVESPDKSANQKLVDTLEPKFRQLVPEKLRSAEKGPGEVRKFFRDRRWLFASVADLEKLECSLFRERARRMPGYLDLGECDLEESKETTGTGARSGSTPTLKELRERLEERTQEIDRFPDGYFRTSDGKSFALLLRSPTAGMGEVTSDRLFDDVKDIVSAAAPQSFHPEMVVGYAGDIPNAIAERTALVHDVKTVSFVAIGLILASIVFFFRSFLSLLHIGLAVAAGSGVAFAAAMGAFGHLNAATSFLGSIIAGNGINYGIIYLARYRERRGAGDGVEEALVDSALTCRRATWLAALAASGAYAALMLTSFRGFSEFGLIGGVGMVACWATTFLVCPASIAAVELFRRRVSRKPSARFQSSGSALAFATGLTRRSPAAILGVALVASIAAAMPLSGYLSDPWEYNFNKLKSRSSAERGAGHFSKKSNEIFGRRGSPTLVLADTMEDSLEVARQINEQDQKVTGGTFIKRVETIYDVLGGEPAVVEEKLELLDEIRDHIDTVRSKLKGEDAELADEWRPPDDLRAIDPKELPPLVLDKFSEKDGRVGTAVFVHLERTVSRSRGENLLKIADIVEGVRVHSGEVAPNASRAAVFAAMIRSMERDGPRATLAAFLVVVLVSVLVGRRVLATLAVVGSLILGVLWTVGGAAWLDVRLNFLNFVALPLTFGIGVDYAVNLYERIRLSGGDVVEGVRSAGGAVALCSSTTIFGYGALCFADNQALQSFGRYAIAGEVACIITAIFVMPAALLAASRVRRAS